MDCGVIMLACEFGHLCSLAVVRTGRPEKGNMDLRISERKSGNVTILDLQGRVVLGANNDSLAAELRKLAESAPCNVLINLAEATQVDSSGISTLVRSFVTLERDGGSLKILNPTGHVREILELTRLVQCFPTYTDEAEALASFRSSAAHA
jgi:anti-anti-sigma factor